MVGNKCYHLGCSIPPVKNRKVWCCKYSIRRQGILFKFTVKLSSEAMLVRDFIIIVYSSSCNSLFWCTASHAILCFGVQQFMQFFVLVYKSLCNSLFWCTVVHAILCFGVQQLMQFFVLVYSSSCNSLFWCTAVDAMYINEDCTHDMNGQIFCLIYSINLKGTVSRDLMLFKIKKTGPHMNRQKRSYEFFVFAQNVCPQCQHSR